MNIQLVVSDIDGTLLITGEPASPATIQAVRACRAKGVEFAVCSGRWFPAARDVAVNQLGVQDGYMIICNGGAVVRTDGEILMEDGLTDAQARAIYDLLKGEPVLITSYVRGAIHRLHTQHLTVFHLPEQSSYFGDCLYGVFDDDEEIFLQNALNRPYKMEAYCDDYALLARLREKIEAMGLQVNSAFPFNLEIMRPGTGKGAAVRFLTKHLGLERAQVMGMGDYSNDLPMLENCGLPVAMGNALEEVKRICRVVAPDCRDDGAAWALHKYVLGDEEA